MFRRFLKTLLIAASMLAFASCDDFFTKIDKIKNSQYKMSFDEDNYDLYKDGFLLCYVSSEPDGLIVDGGATFTVTDTDVAKVVNTGTDYCMLQGVETGSTVLTCTYSGVTAQCVVNVIENKSLKIVGKNE